MAQTVIESFEDSPLNGDLTWTNTGGATMTRTTNNVTEGTYSWRATYSATFSSFPYPNTAAIDLRADIDLSGNAGEIISLDYTVTENGTANALVLELPFFTSGGSFISALSSSVSNGSGTFSGTIPSNVGKIGIVYRETTPGNPSGETINCTLDLDNLRVGSQDFPITAGTGSFTLTGQSVNLLTANKLVAGTGSFTLTGQAASFDIAKAVSAGTGAFTLTGQSTGLTETAILEAGNGSFVLTGQAAALALGFSMTVSAGSFSLTGQSVGEVYNQVLTAGVGSFVLSGQAVDLKETVLLQASAGQFTLAGQSAGAYHGYPLTASYGDFTLTGQSASSVFGYTMASDFGSFTLTGQAAAEIYTQVLAADYGFFDLQGKSLVQPAASISVTGYNVNVSTARNPKIARESQKFSTDNLVELFELDCTDLGGSTLRFTGSAFPTEAIEYGGNTYTPVPIMAEGFEVNGKGTLPTPTLKILNSNSLQASLISLNDLQGAVVRRIKTFRCFLDQGENPDPNAHFPIDVFKVDRKVAGNKYYVEWVLAAAIDQEGRQIPGRQVLRNYCQYTYRVWNSTTESFDYTNATCPYTGSKYYDTVDSVCSITGDVCGKRLSSCKLRFGENASLPFGGFPGVARIR